MNCLACLCGTPGVDVCSTCQQQPIVKPVLLPKPCQSSPFRAIGDTCSCANSIVQPAIVPKTCGCQVCVKKAPFKLKPLPALPPLNLPQLNFPPLKPHVHLIDLLKNKIGAKCQEEPQAIEDDNAIAQSDCDCCIT